MGGYFSDRRLDVFRSLVLVILPTGYPQLPKEKVKALPLSLTWYIIWFSVAGFSLEFALLNPSGFFFYSVYSVAGSIDPFLGTGEVSKLKILKFT